METRLLKNIPPYFSALTKAHRNAQVFLACQLYLKNEDRVEKTSAELAEE